MKRQDMMGDSMAIMGRSPLLIAVVAVLALAACGKKPDFPAAPTGSSTPRLYPDPTRDPGYVPPPPGTARPAPAAAPAGQPAPAGSNPDEAVKSSAPPGQIRE